MCEEPDCDSQGVEICKSRWAWHPKELARALNKHPDVVSNWASNGGVLRQADLRFSEVIDDLDRRLSVILTEGKEV
jgi:hypothetical protein